MKFDLTLFGATGFTGQLVAEALWQRAPKSVNIALAGRSLDKLASVKNKIGATSWTLVQADSADSASLNSLAKNSKVICTTVGPYGKYGLPLVKACAENGTHYCDLAGEPLFMRDSVVAFHEVAQKSGSKIVHACGFDSIPSDLGVWLLAKHIGPLKQATLLVERMRGGFSGGTVASGIETALNKNVRDVIDINLLAPHSGLPKVKEVRGVEFDEFLKRKVGPFVMGQVNARVVRRSQFLLPEHHGKELRYREVSRVKSGFLNGLSATFAATSMGLFPTLVKNPVTAPIMKILLPKPGEGPTLEQRKNGLVQMLITGESISGTRGAVRFEGKGDPGYQLTSLLLSESALCLALDSLSGTGGVLTPSSAMPVELLKRFEGTDAAFSVVAV
jgi:short subunit dehydrogenase-like uncharacterized protein